MLYNNQCVEQYTSHEKLNIFGSYVACEARIEQCELGIRRIINKRGHGGRVVTVSPPTSAAGVRSPSWP